MCSLLTSPRHLRETPHGLLRIGRARVADEAKVDGEREVISNDDTLSADDQALCSKDAMPVEECWRTMKSGLRTQHVFH